MWEGGGGGWLPSPKYTFRYEGKGVPHSLNRHSQRQAVSLELALLAEAAAWTEQLKDNLVRLP